MANPKKPTSETVGGLVYGLLIGWGVGTFWWSLLVVAFGLEPSIVEIVVDSTGRRETQVTALERLALVPVRSIPWAAVAGVVGAAIGWNRKRTATGKPLKISHRAITGLAFGLLSGWIVGVFAMTSLAITFGPSGATYEHGGVVRIDQFSPTLETIADLQWLVIPWVIVGALTGLVIGALGSWLEIVTSLLGMIGGICFVLSTSLFDGWLAITMPIYAFMGTGIGLADGLFVRHVIIRLLVFMRQSILVQE
jgi:hypothetical protein